MLLPDLDRLKQRLACQFGIAFDLAAEFASGERVVRGEPRLADSGVVFSFAISEIDTRIRVIFDPGNYAIDLVRHLVNPDSDCLMTYRLVLKEINRLQRTRVRLKVDGAQREPERLGEFDAEPRDFSLQMDRFGFEGPSREIEDWIVLGVSLPLALIPFDFNPNRGVADSIRPYDAEEEGERVAIKSIRYERSPVNRALAIQLHGWSCGICRFSFSDSYGDLGEEFIEVHHIHALAESAALSTPDPAVDLIPLCANCHRMVHRERPPIRPEALRAMMKMGAD